MAVDENALRAARRLQTDGRFVEAESAYRRLLQQFGDDETVLSDLEAIYAQAGYADGVRSCLTRLVRLCPHKADYAMRLAELYDRHNNPDKAIAIVQTYLERQSDDAEVWFELAGLQRRLNRNDEAMASLDQALRAGGDIASIQTNRSAILSDLRREDEAMDALSAVLKIDPGHSAARFNLAALTEETGALTEARELYTQVLDTDPDYWPALARLAGITSNRADAETLCERIGAALERPLPEGDDRTDLLYARGKLFDDLKRYDEAFQAYAKANAADRRAGHVYDRSRMERFASECERIFAREKIDEIEPISDVSPIIICGMFRSGSTLVEQILAAHSQVDAGGEIEFFDHWAHGQTRPFPACAAGLNTAQRRDLIEAYCATLAHHQADLNHVTDKRPDNLLYLGLIGSLFPKARIIVTRRNALDNALSVFFARLGPAMGYACDLADIAHYYRQQNRLLDHWRNLFGDRMIEISYDALVADPEPNIRHLLERMGLDWEPECLDFHKLRNTVKTASAWQVRQPLHTTSSGRSAHYAAHLASIRDELE